MVSKVLSKNCFQKKFPVAVYAGCPKIIVPCLCDDCRGAVDSIMSAFTQLHRSGFNLEFETLFGSI